jgi:hypothetical protein
MTPGIAFLEIEFILDNLSNLFSSSLFVCFFFLSFVSRYGIGPLAG